MTDLHLNAFVDEFITLVNTFDDFDKFTETRKKKYWLPRTKWLIDVLPWNEIRDAGLNKQRLEVFDDSYALLICTYTKYPIMNTSNTYFDKLVKNL